MRAAHELTKFKLPPYWVGVDEVVKKLGIPDSGKVNDAIAYAVTNGLLRVDIKADPHSVTVTADGVKLANQP